MATPQWPPQDRMAIIGTRVSRLDGPAKVTGTAKYAYDINRPNMLFAKILSAPYGHATVASIDVEPAKNMAGVEAVIVDADVGAEINYYGQIVAVVAATSEEIANDALKAIRVSYNVLTPELDDKDRDKAQDRPSSRDQGNVEDGFAQAEVTSEGQYGLEAITHCCHEPHGQACEMRDGELHVWATTQNVSKYSEGIRDAAELPSSKIHVDCQYMGGGFGSKFGSDRWGALCTLLAKQTGKPVKLMLERDQELAIAGARTAVNATVKIGAKRDGTITAFESYAWGSSGWGNFGAPPMPYVFTDIPNWVASSNGIRTNRNPVRAWRAPNHPHACHLTMSAMEDAAAALGMDALEFFMKNLQFTPREAVYKEELEIAAEMIGYKNRAHPRGDTTPGPLKSGLGISIHTWGGGGHNSACDVTIHPDGSVVSRCGTQDLGTGTRTAIGIVVAETLGLPIEQVKVEIGRDSYPPSGASGGSTTIGGVSSSSRDAATKALNALLEVVAPKLNVTVDKLEAAEGRIREIGNPGNAMSWEEACRELGVDAITRQGTKPLESGIQLDNNGVGGVQIADVTVDIETGLVTINEMVCVQDCGLIIDLKTAESQVYGAMIMGVTYALCEEAVYDPTTGRMLNADMEFYKLACLGDVGNLRVHMMQTPEHTSRGVIGLGEPPVISPGAAIANAVANACGVRVPMLPLTADRVLAAIEKGGQVA
jgi:xanthine dehydrogenase YagR molybdenum-binding subunit